MVKFFSEFKSIKENLIDSILDKIVVNNITQKDIDMLNLVNSKEIKEHHLVSVNSLIQILNQLLEENERIFCKLTDSQGEINLFVTGVETSNELHFLILNKETFKLGDNFLYNIRFDFEKNYWIIEYSQVYSEEISI